MSAVPFSPVNSFMSQPQQYGSVGYPQTYQPQSYGSVTQPVGTMTQRQTIMVPRQVIRTEAIPVQHQYVTQPAPVPQTAKLTGSVTIPKQSVVMESHSVEHKAPKYEYDVRTVNCPKTVEIEKQIMETKLVAIQVPKTIKTPSTVMEERYIKIPKHVYEKKIHTRKVPRMVYDDQEFETTEQVYETRIHTVQQPRTVTTYETVPVESVVPTALTMVSGPGWKEDLTYQPQQQMQYQSQPVPYQSQPMYSQPAYTQAPVSQGMYGSQLR